MTHILVSFRTATPLLLFQWAVYAFAQSSSPIQEVIAKPPQNEAPVLFTGFPAVLELSGISWRYPLGKVDANPRCEGFTLLSYSGILPEVRITTSGLGQVDFPSSGGNTHNEVTVANIDNNGVGVRFCIQGELLREPGTSAQGKLVAFAKGYKPATVAIKVVRPDLPIWVKVLEWFFAILVPAVIAGAIGFGSTWSTSALTQRRDQKSAFRKFKDEKWEDLTQFFRTYLRNVITECKTEEQFTLRLREELQTKGYWTEIPWRERDRIDRFIRRHEASRMRSVLAALFPEWKSDLSGLKK